MTWLRHFRRAFLTALTWGVLWAPLGVIAGIIWDPNDSMDEPWIAVGAYPGFLCGLVFCLLLTIADGRRRLDELSASRAAAWGALAGLIMMALPSLLATPNTEHPFWQWRYMIVAAVALLSSISAVGSVLLARTANKRELHNGSSGAA